MTAVRLCRPSPALAAHVDYFGSWEGGAATAAHTSRALPRGAATAIIDVGGADSCADFYAADGRTRLSVSAAFVAGPGVASHVIRIEPARSAMTIHFRPAGALAFLGCPLRELAGAFVDLTQLWGSGADVLRAQLVQSTSVPRRAALLESFLLARLRRCELKPQPWLGSVLRAAELNPSMRVSLARDLTGLAPKRFNTLFRSDVGLTPKAYFRVRRLQAALRALRTPAQIASIAADLGYFDQAHLVHEFRAFTATTPSEYARRLSVMPGQMPGHVQLADRQAETYKQGRDPAQMMG